MIKHVKQNSTLKHTFSGGLPLVNALALSFCVGTANAEQMNEQGIVPVEENQSTQAAAEAVKPNAATAAVQSDWRESLLGELTSLANEVDKQRKFNDMLRDRIDILNHRIEELETRNAEQAKELSGLGEAQKALEAQQKEALAQVPGAPNTSEPMPENQQAMRQDDKTAPAPEATKPSPKAEDLPGDFEQFLDMGEAMMRRFFGVVKEFREEFEDNRV